MTAETTKKSPFWEGFKNFLLSVYIYILTFAGVVMSPFIEQYKAGTLKQLRFDKAEIIVSAFIALIVVYILEATDDSDYAKKHTKLNLAKRCLAALANGTLWYTLIG